LIALVVVVPLLAQANTGKITGKVTAEGQPLPGVTVTATSENLPGERVDVTRETGEFVLPQLPAGDYDLVLALEGFGTVRMPVKVNVNQVTDVQHAMTVSNVAEEIVVTGEASTISLDTQGQTTYRKEDVEKLAITRTIEDAVVLAPGVHATGPRATTAINGAAISISGSQSYENLFMVNGVVVSENTRGQAIEFIIEDAVEETTVSSSGVSAEYGRFNGGVVNVITKSGGNQFHGSFRINVDKEAWEGRNDLTPEDQNNTTNETYEATLGGRFITDHLWFFVAGRDLARSANQGLPVTGIALAQDTEHTREEFKLTVSPHPSHRLIGAYMERETERTNEHFSAIDFSNVNPSRVDPEDLTSVHYSGVLTSNFFVEAQYSERNWDVAVGSGGKTKERIGGTWIVDLTRFRFIGSPTFCDPALCVQNERNNENGLAKLSYFLTTETAGSHDLIAGFDTFEDINVIENHQSASDFSVWAFQPFIVRGQNVFPQFTNNGTNRLRWNPVLETTQGMKFETDSIFLNDTWRLGDKWSFNLGVRYDENNSVNGSGAVISDDSKFSPRVAAAYDLNGDGNWVFNATYGQYAASVNTGANIGGVTGSAGALGDWTWLYNGPNINADATAPVLLTDLQALEAIFAWFDSIGGTTNTSQRINLTIPGLGLQVPESLVTPSAEEYTVGVIKRLGTRGVVRADVVSREYGDFYNRRADTGTGTVVNPDGSRSDLHIFQNSDDPQRKYDGLHTQASYRLTDRIMLAGNWTWSHSRGTFDGETQGNAALPWTLDQYPELKTFDRIISYGDLQNDQRHKVALWGIWDILDGEHQKLSASLLQRFYSGHPFNGSALNGPGAVDTSRATSLYAQPIIAAAGYLNAPPTVDYWFWDRDEFLTEDWYTTDIAVTYAFGWRLFGKHMEVFVTPQVLNVFNEDTVLFPDATIQDYRTAGAGLVRFNPLTTTPVEGVHFRRGPNFGKALAEGDYQPPRTFRFSVGFRF
jgi:outer membrane receptor for ferrienterochelin and colicin